MGSIVRTVLKPAQYVMSKSVLNASIESFDKELPLKLRELINPLVRNVVRHFLKRELIIESLPKLENKVPYIYAITHSFDEDLSSVLATIDRNAYILIGTGDQIKVNPQIFAGWLNGMIYVDRQDRQSRKDSLVKMEKVIEKGKSIIIFPEGFFNNTENLLVQELFSGVFKINSRTGAKIVPVSPFSENKSNKIYINYHNPISLEGMSEKEGLILLRDILATMKWEQIIKHTKPIQRSQMEETKNYHIDFLEQRRQEYLRVYWESTESLLKEIDYYKNLEKPKPFDLWSTFSNVVITPKNIRILLPILIRLKEYEDEDLHQYIKKTGINI